MNQTHLWVSETDETILGYFALAPTVVSPGPSDDAVPGILLAKLALCEELRGSEPKVGPMLLVEALRAVCMAAEIIGGRLLAVDAQHEKAHNFYRENGFTPIEGDGQRLIFKMKTVKALFA